MASTWTTVAVTVPPRDSPNANTPNANAASAARAFISEIAVTALSLRSASWNAANPPNVATMASAVQPVRLDRGVSHAVEDARGDRSRRRSAGESERGRGQHRHQRGGDESVGMEVAVGC
jgi:hypothetical protein